MRALRFSAVSVAFAVTVASLTTLTASTSSAADGCSQSPAKLVFRIPLGRDAAEVQLRATTDDICAWGRIVAGVPGDTVWVDRSYNGGATWEQLGVTRVETGSSNYTPAYNDAGKLMRACGHPNGYPGQARCTDWW
ncbi:MAG: hypothetical protein QOH03_3219 [Kribbellaceae bacterium]|jgi:hypothetical protein|nr:hypothetical protein [Kribbellaceae bacterium]